jgi:hypothetical protein
MRQIAWLCVVAGVFGCKSFEDYQNGKKRSEASLQLNRLAKYAKVYWVTNNAFPVGTAKPLPPGGDGTAGKGCCGAKSNGSTVDNKCPVSAEWGKDPVWNALDFQIDDPSQYVYHFEATSATSFTATAEGDLDCDGETANYTLTGTVDSKGNITTSITPPPKGKY